MTDHVLSGTIAVEIEAGEKGKCFARVPTYRLPLASIFLHMLPDCSPEPKNTARVHVCERERAPLLDAFSRGRIVYSLSEIHANSSTRRGAMYSMGMGHGCSRCLEQKSPKQVWRSPRR